MYVIPIGSIVYFTYILPYKSYMDPMGMYMFQLVKKVSTNYITTTTHVQGGVSFLPPI